MQAQLVAGDSFSLLNTFVAYPPADGWTLKTRLVPRLSTSAAIILTAVTESLSYRTTAAPATTALWTAGDYSAAQWVEKAGQRITLATGEMKILPDPSAMVAGSDTRTHLEKTIANLEAMLEGRATQDVQEYTIGNRQLKHMAVSELLVWLDKYKFQLANERAANSLTKKLGFGRKIHMRF